jgi:Rieske Fe-S protein
MSDVTRRGFLAGICTLAAAGVLAPPAAAAGGISRLPDGRLAVNVRQVPQLSRPGGAVRIGVIDGKPVGVARTGARTYVAFSLACPHQGVTVRGGSQGWTCPAHGSTFEADGRLEMGPATRGLTRVPSTLARGVLIVG